MSPVIYMKVIGLAGQRLSGKNLFAYYLRKKYGFSVLDFTINILSPILRKQGKSITRENLVRLAMSLRKKYGIDFLVKNLRERIKNGKYVIAGIRFPEEAIYLKKEFGKDFILIGIECDAMIRYERAKKKKTKEDRGMTYGDFLRKERFPTEKIIPETMKLSNLTVTNEKSKKDLYEKIDQVMEKTI